MMNDVSINVVCLQQKKVERNGESIVPVFVYGWGSAGLRVRGAVQPDKQDLPSSGSLA